MLPFWVLTASVPEAVFNCKLIETRVKQKENVLLETAKIAVGIQQIQNVLMQIVYTRLTPIHLHTSNMIFPSGSAL